MQTKILPLSAAEIDRISEAGHAIYQERLKAILEPVYNGQVVAIHLESGDYEIAPFSRSAWTALRARRPNGMMMVMDIGPAKVDSLTVRMLANQILTRQGK